MNALGRIVSGTLLTCLFMTACYRSVPLDEKAIRQEISYATHADGEDPAPLDGSDSTVFLTEDRAVILAVSRDPGIDVAEAELAVARAGVRKATGIENPELRVNNENAADGGLDYDRVLVALRWSPPRLPEYLAVKEAAEAEVPVAEAGVDDSRRRIRKEARLAFANASFSRHKRELAARRVAVLQRRLDLLRSSVAGGLADPLDAMSAEIDLNEALDEEMVFASEEREGMGALRILLGLSSEDGANIEIPPGPPACLPPPDDIDTIEDLAASDHPLVRLRRAAYRHADLTLKREHARKYPWFRFVQVGYEHSDTGTRSGVHFGVSLDLPILDWNQGGIALGEARRDRETCRFKETLSEVLSSIGDSIGQWRAAWERMGRLKERALPLAEGAATMTAEAVNSGRLSELESLDAKEDALAIQESALDAAQACVEASIEAEFSVGVPVEDWSTSPTR